MTSRLENLKAAYYKLSSLYKNPTRYLRGMAASDQNAVLAKQHAEMRALFDEIQWGTRAEKTALYFKVLALLYEVDDYRGSLMPSGEQEILKEPLASVEHFNTRRETQVWQTENFSSPKVRTLWKAKVLCCVAAIESRRKNSDSVALLRELDVLEEFVYQKLHRPDLPAWTTLAFVRTAQARVARQAEKYTYVRSKLLSVVECLDERAAEIIYKLSEHSKELTDLRRRKRDKKTKRIKEEKETLLSEIKGLEDDLIFIRQKHTLTVLFSYGLDNLQRGFLDNASHACQAARFLFRLHGHTYHRLFNELLIIAIKRARTSRKQKHVFLSLERELTGKILPHLEPKGILGNWKIYLYGLRELAVIQHACGKSAEMRSTLRKMEQITPLGPQWKSRISLLYSRAFYGAWQGISGEIKDRKPDQLLDALNHCEMAFNHAAGGKDGIGSHADAQSLLAYVKDMGNRNLIDTMESLITYGTVQLFLKKYFDVTGNRARSGQAVAEALKSAHAVMELSGPDNPRLLAMGYLVAADAYREMDFIVEARLNLETAKTLEARIQHEYVKDRRKAIEEKIPTTLTLYQEDCGHIDNATKRLFGWYIGNCKDKSSIYRISKQLGINKARIKKYIEGQGKSSPYYYLLKLDRENKKHKDKKKGSGANAKSGK